jgi:hypothetical protein
VKIARVFPTRTSMSPLDQDAYFGEPELFMPDYDEIHISVTFTWNIKRAYWLRRQWERFAPVKVGGIAINGEPKGEFESGKYLREGASITSRGCPNRCSWCLVKQDLIELDTFPEGNIIQDNNFLACSRSHKDKVYQMLLTQKGIDFSGGLDSTLLGNEDVERLRGLRIHQLFLAYDHASRAKQFTKACLMLREHFSRDQVRAYVLIGFNKDTIEKAESRLRMAYNFGSLPFAMLYRNEEGEYPQPQKEWKVFQRKWCRPAIIKTIMKG